MSNNPCHILRVIGESFLKSEFMDCRALSFSSMPVERGIIPIPITVNKSISLAILLSFAFSPPIIDPATRNDDLKLLPT